VFKEPKGVPPIRFHDHSNPLQQGVQPISVRLYRYPFYQREEIEKIVRELLKSKVIRKIALSPVLFCWRRRLMALGECAWIIDPSIR
jgi:hypothetical protein